MNTGNISGFRWANRVKFLNTSLSISIEIYLLFLGYFFTPLVYATEDSSKSNNLEIRNTQAIEIGIEIGALTLLGTDVRLFFRQADSPWLIGYRFLDIEDDFINEAVVGLPGDDSDKEFTKRSGPYVNYLFNETGNGSFYITGALYQVKTTVVCTLGEDSDSATSIYLGGGYRKKWNSNLGYNIGLLLSPTTNLSVDSNDCSSESEGDFDLNASLIFAF